MAGGSYFEVEARVVSPGVVARVLALIEPAAQAMERRLQEAMRRGLEGGGRLSATQGGKSGALYAEAFSRALRTRLEAAMRSLPDIKLKADSSDVDRDIFRIREEIQRILVDDTYRLELGIDDKEVQARLRLLQGQLERISRTSPDIRVRVNTSTALAELAALRREMDGFGRDSRIKRLFSGNLFGDGIRQLVQSLRNASPVLDSLIGKVSELGTKIQSVGSDATAGIKNNPIAGLAASSVMLQAILVALTTVGPLVAAAIGGMIGLAGAVGVAAAAFVGLREQAAKGVGVGAYISDQLSTISSGFRDLGRLAADAIGPAIRDLLSVTQRVLPTFSGLTRLVGDKLGGAVRGFGTGLLTAIQKAQPIIVIVADYIEKAGEAFRRWTASESFEHFVGYIARELPVVAGFAKSLGTFLIDGFKAVAPVGEVVLRILSGVFSALSGISNIVGGVIDFLSGGGSDTSGTEKQVSSIQDLLNQLTALGPAQQQAATGFSALQQALGATNPAYAAAMDSAAQAAEQLKQTTLEMRLQNDAAGLLKQGLDELSGKNLGVAQSFTTFRTGLLDLGEGFKGAAFDATGLSKAALDQQSALQQAVQAAQAHAEAVGTQTGSTVAATDALKADYQAILDATGATGANRQAILDYITALGGVPPVVPTKIDANTALAETRVAMFKQLYQNLPPGTVTISANTDSASAAIQRLVSTPRTVYVQVQTVSGTTGAPSGGRAVFEATGGIIKAYAAGGLSRKVAATYPHFAAGIEKHVPQIARGGMTRIWNEPETHGEAYIPLANDWRRARALQIWAQTGREIGAIRPMPQGASGGGGPVEMTGTMTLDTGSMGTLAGRVRMVADQSYAANTANAAFQNVGPGRKF